MQSELTPRRHDAQITQAIKNRYRDVKRDPPAEKTLMSATILSMY